MPQSFKRLLKQYSDILQEYAKRGDLTTEQAANTLFFIHRVGSEQIGFANLIKAVNQRLIALFDEALAI